MLQLFCRHEWKLDKTTMPSPFQQMKFAGVKRFKAGYIEGDMFATKTIIVATCPKCGKIKKWTEESE